MIIPPKFFELFGFDTSPIVGLDIGSSAVKVLMLVKHGDRIKVEKYGFELLEPGVVQEKAIVDREKVIAAIKSAMLKAGVNTKRVCVSIPSSQAITKVIKMGADLNDKDIGSEIELESGKYIPYPLTEVNFDYTVIGPVENVEGMVNVLLIASKTENVANAASLIIEAGLVAAIVDVDSYAMMRAFELVTKRLPGQGKNKVIAIFDIGATMTTLTILDKGNVVYAREQAFGSHQLIEEIQNIYGLNHEEAIQALKYENLPKDFYPEILEPFKQSVAQQISRFCQFFFSAGEYNSIDYIFLTGGGANIFGLETVVQNKLQVKTFIANPFAEMVLDAQISKDVFKDASLRLMKCAGLALRNIE